MKGLKYIALLIVLLSMLSRKQTYAQDNTPFADENVDDLGDVSDAFQEAFFEALKQKGIENYDRAIEQLNKCIKLDISNSYPILYFERGKNYQLLKENDLAERDFLKALELKPNQEPVLALLYELYYVDRDFEKAEGVIKQLIPFNSQYKEDLARLYSATKRYDEALVLIEELDNEKGKDRFRDTLKKRIYKFSGKKDRAQETVNKDLEKNATSEQDYLKLIYLYSEQGETEKAYETALKLQKTNPEADAVQLALYKIDISKGNTEKAIGAMTKVMESKQISAKAKHRVLNDFLIFVNDNPSYEPQLEAAIATFDSKVADSNIYQNIAAYYTKKGLKDKALPYLTSALNKDTNNIDLLKRVLTIELEQGKFAEASQRAKEALELYPSQPSLYYTYGRALKGESKYQEAAAQFETGVDYIIDDIELESAFYKELGETYLKLGDSQKAKRYTNQAAKLRAGN